jgi:pyruvate-ferredoxin/flavodoxin oxidoreductase
MAQYIDEWAANGRKNIFGETVEVVEMQSEGGASGAVHGALQGGALTSTFTASQGLLLMLPNMNKMSGELLPAVFHVSARSIAGHALSIFGDHSDIYHARPTGFAMIASGSVQETMDLAGVAHLASIKSRIPFIHFFDGFRTSHEIQKIEAMDQDVISKLVDKDAIQAFRDEALNPEHPVTRGTAQNPDIYFQAKESPNKYYDAVPDIVSDYLNEISEITGRHYRPFNYYGDPDAKNIIVAMGSVTDTIRETIDFLFEQGESVGLMAVHLYRPFSAKYFFEQMPASVERIAVLDRTKEPGSNGEPLYLDVRNLFYGKPNAPIIVGGRYGLSSKDTTPAMIVSVFRNLDLYEPKNDFTVGIVDDVTYKSLELLPEIDLSVDGTVAAKFYGLGADGTVGANKNSIKIIGENTDKYAQAYFSYDSKKSGGITVSHLRFGDDPIRSTYLVNNPDFVACHVPSYLDKYDMLKGLKKGGSFLLNSILDAEKTKAILPNNMKKYLADNEISFYIMNATAIAQEIGLGNKTNTIMQSAFFKVSEVIPYDLAVSEMKKAIVKTYGKKGEEIVNMNYAAVDRGGEVTKVEIPAEWKELEYIEVKSRENVPGFVKNICDVIFRQDGDSLPVSAFSGKEDGQFENGSTQYEKRGVAVNVPEWVSENCIQCNQCSYVCPHATIRPFLINEEEMKNLPEGTKTLKAIGKGLEGHQYKIQVSTLDCVGCGNCVDICPAPKGKAIEMKPLETQEKEIALWDHFAANVTYKELLPKTNVKATQFAQPLFEFSGACAGCGETPYIKLITQLFGDRMIIANATGCSSIYGGSAPATPYCKNAEGKGPAWANSLFEDNAEYGLGMAVAVDKLRDRIERIMTTAIGTDCCNAEIKGVFQEWVDNKNDAEGSKAASAKVLEILDTIDCEYCNELKSLKQYFIKKSMWIFGGDGWAYDIGFGGLDHVIASGKDVNILVMDTEVYSNTGGQASKATPVGAVAKFAASGMKTRKKDLGLMATTYGYVYVAQVAMGANQAQYLKVIKEAEAYPGPSLVIAYSPCINHGIKGGMGKAQAEEKLAVEAGFWHLWKFNPTLEAEGKNPFVLESKEPQWDKFQEFLKREARYTILEKTFPDEADKLFKIVEDDMKWRYKNYKRLASFDFSE